MPAITRKMANDARQGVNTGKLSDLDYQLLDIPRKRIQRCGSCKCPGHKRTNCSIFAYRRDARPMHDAEEYFKISRRRTSHAPQTEYDYMDAWINEYGTDDLTPEEYRKYVSHVNEFTKKLVKYRLTVARDSQRTYRYWF